MSHDALWQTTESLCTLLQEAATAAPGARVSAEAPESLTQHTALVHVHLYAVIPDEGFRHQDRLPHPSGLPVLPLRLRYLVSTQAPDATTSQRLLARALGCLYGRDYLDAPDAGTPAALRPRIAIVQAELEELERAWGRRALPRPLGVIIEVGPVFVDGADADPAT